MMPDHMPGGKIGKHARRMATFLRRIIHQDSPRPVAALAAHRLADAMSNVLHPDHSSGLHRAIPAGHIVPAFEMPSLLDASAEDGYADA